MPEVTWSDIVTEGFQVRAFDYAHDTCLGCGSGNHDTADCIYANDDQEEEDEDTYCSYCDRYTDHSPEDCPEAEEDVGPGPGGCRCELCQYNARRQERDSGGPNPEIHYWDYRPRPQFHGKGPLFLGMELEVECSRGRRRPGLIAEEGMGELGYLKSDGSLSNGFEIVTHPMSYPFFVRKFPWDMLPRLRDAGAEVGDGTGIHVHVSRAGFTDPVHQFKWLKWWHRSRDQVSHLAGRDSGRWAAYRPEDREAVKDVCKGRHSRGRWQDSDYWTADRYSAVNVTNPDTYEVRVFRSSLEPERVKSMIGLVDASVHFTRELTVPDIFTRQAWSWGGLSDWVSSTPTRRQKYHDLMAPMAQAANHCDHTLYNHGRGVY